MVSGSRGGGAIRLPGANQRGLGPATNRGETPGAMRSRSIGSWASGLCRGGSSPLQDLVVVGGGGGGTPHPLGGVLPILVDICVTLGLSEGFFGPISGSPYLALKFILTHDGRPDRYGVAHMAGEAKRSGARPGPLGFDCHAWRAAADGDRQYQ